MSDTTTTALEPPSDIERANAETVRIAMELECVTAELAEERKERDLERLAKRESCPCVHTVPCHEDCTCIKPFMSRGCARCCTYGCKEQQIAAAERFVGREHKLGQLAIALRTFLTALGRGWRMEERRDCVNRAHAALRDLGI